MQRLLAVLGRDVSRSRSPELHARAANRLGLEVAYVPVSCADEAHFDRAVDALMCLGALGANVTIPYKARALARATRRTATAQAIGAANVLSFDAEGGIEADNTDGPALLEILSASPPATLARVVVLGAGGAARAAVWALVEAGAPSIVVAARDTERAAALARLGPRIEVVPLGPVAGATLAISALPSAPSLAREALDRWITAPQVLDLAYGPSDGTTPLVTGARQRGLEATDGLPMLIAQAAHALARWTGADRARIREAMVEGWTPRL